jgi:sugar lactone lactonase YvrE
MFRVFARRSLVAGVALVLASATFISGAAPVGAANGRGTLIGKELISGSPIHGANGLAIDQQGRLLVASAFGHELVALDPDTGRVLERIGPVVDGVDVGGPDDVAVAPDGSICWTDLTAGNVDCLRTDGSVDSQFVAVGVNPIAFTPDGRLFVALAFFGDDLYELDPNLVDPPTLLMSGSGIPPWPDQLNGFDFGPDGLLYAPRPFSGPGEIVRIDVDADPVTMEVVASGFPAASVEFDPAGNLYANLPVTGEVVRVDIETGATSHVAWLSPNLDNMTFDEAGRLYVSNSHDGSVVRILKSGQVRVLARPGLILPGGIAAIGGGPDGSDRLYITNLWSLAEYSGRTGRFTSIDFNSHLGGTITTPWTVAADGANVIVTSVMANLVQIWDPAADTEVASWPDFAVPVNAIRFGADLVVAELGTHSIVRQTPGGIRTTLTEQLYYPSGLAASGDDLWVSDWATGIVWRIVTDGSPSMTPVATGLASPEGIAVEPDGSLLVVEAGAGRLTRIPTSGAPEVLVDGLTLGAPGEPGFPPAWVFNGVTVGPSGAIYVTGDVDSAVWRFTEVPG